MILRTSPLFCREICPRKSIFKIVVRHISVGDYIPLLWTLPEERYKISEENLKEKEVFSEAASKFHPSYDPRDSLLSAIHNYKA